MHPGVHDAHRRAIVECGELGRLRSVGFQKIGQAEQHCGPSGRGQTTPRGLGRSGRRHRVVHVAFSRQPHHRLRRCGRCVAVLVGAAGVAVAPEAGDQVALRRQPADDCTDRGRFQRRVPLRSTPRRWRTLVCGGPIAETITGVVASDYVHAMRRFEGRIALVSGAAGGIGAAVADRLADEGAIVVRSDLAEAGAEFACDVTDPNSVAATVSEVMRRHGRLDVLANVAGTGVARRSGDLTLDEWRRVLDVNLTGTFLLSQAALPALIQARGTIVNMASMAGLRATPYNAAYCASKGGVIMLTKSMALEFAGDGVRVNAVCPASVDTPFLRGFRLPEGADMALLGRAASPMGRLIDPAEVAAAVAYLASDEAATVSGTTLVIDGAATA